MGQAITTTFNVWFQSNAEKQIALVKKALKYCEIDYRIVDQRWAGGYNSKKNRAYAKFQTSSKADAKRLRNVMRTVVDLRASGIKASVYSSYLKPDADQPVEPRNQDLMDLLSETAKANGFNERAVLLTYNIIRRYKIEDEWMSLPAEELMSLDRVGKKTLNLMLLARGEEPVEVESHKHRKQFDVQAAFMETLNRYPDENESILAMRELILTGSRHPELLNAIMDISFDLGRRYQKTLDLNELA